MSFTIVLIGPKHTGKTTLGRALAALYGGVCVDLDDAVEQRTGKSPRTLFREGPDQFQAAEAAALQAFFDSSESSPAPAGPRILATGGGIIDNPAAVALLTRSKTHTNAGVLLLCLDIPADVAWERIHRSGSLPPFLDTANPQETHRALHERRTAACRALADVILQPDA